MREKEPKEERKREERLGKRVYTFDEVLEMFDITREELEHLEADIETD